MRWFPALFFQAFFWYPPEPLFLDFGLPPGHPAGSKMTHKTPKVGFGRPSFSHFCLFLEIWTIFNDFLCFFKVSNPFSHRQGRWNMHFPQISLFTSEGHFGVIFLWFLRLVATPNPFKLALGGSLKSFWILIVFWTSFFWLFMACPVIPYCCMFPTNFCSLPLCNRPFLFVSLDICISFRPFEPLFATNVKLSENTSG